MSLSIEEKRERARERAAAWYWANRERALAGHRERRLGNPEDVKRRRAEYAKANPGYAAGYGKQYYAANRDELLASQRRKNATPEAKAARNARQRERYRTDPIFKLKVILRTRAKNAMRGVRGSGVRLLGCSVVELREYLELHFLVGMTWENYGTAWVIDHIKPLAKFDLTNPEQAQVAFNWSNLRPCWDVENSSKGSRYVEPEPFYD